MRVFQLIADLIPRLASIFSLWPVETYRLEP